MQGGASALRACAPAYGLAANWAAWGNRPQTDDDLAALRRCIRRGVPFGREPWVRRMAGEWNLQSTLRPPGRPRKDRHNREKRSEK